MKALSTLALLVFVVNICAGRHAGHHVNYLKSMGFEKNFMSTNALVNGQHEKRIYYDGIAAKETFVSEEKANRDLALWQVTDGTHFIQSIYFGQQLQDCEYVKDATAISKFLKEFQDDEQKLAFLQNSPEVSMNMSSVTRQYLDNQQPPEDMHKMLNLHLLRKQCDERHELIKAERNIDEDFLQEEHFNTFNQRSRQKRSLSIFPGTKWCGTGNNSPGKTKDPLGGRTAADRCCRRHDRCPYNIHSFDAKYGIRNLGMNTISHCSCDLRFRSCLRTTNDGVGDMIGEMYFNMLKVECFTLKLSRECVKKDYKNGRCLKWAWQKVGKVRKPTPYRPIADPY